MTRNNYLKLMLLAVSLLIGTLASRAAYFDFEVDGICYRVSGSTATVSSGYAGSEYKGDIVIPSIVRYNGNTYTVKYIGGEAFEYCRNLTSVTLPNTIVSIGGDAFHGCSALTEISIPSSVTSIGSLAFSGCSGLTKVNISDISSWCNITFNGYPANPLSDAHHLFLNNEEIKDLVIPSNVTSICKHAFWGCKGLRSVVIPNSVTEIGEWAFYSCSGIKNLSIGRSVISIGDYAFQYCDSITSILCLSKYPPAMNDCFHDNCYRNAILKVPSRTFYFYKSTEYWKKFVNMVGIEILEGDVNNDGIIDVSDVTDLIDFLLQGAPAINMINADVNIDECVDVNDVSELIDNLIHADSEEDHDELAPTETGKLNGYGYVDLGLSVKWATKNLGAYSCIDFGSFFAWGETVPKEQYTWTTYKFAENGTTRMTKYCFSDQGAVKDGKYVLEESDDAASVNMGEGWRMPTLEEMNELIENCTWTWYDNYNGSRRAGYLVQSNVPGYTDNSIFLPADGYRTGNSIGDINKSGSYWTSTLNYESYASLDAVQLHFFDGYSSTYDDRDLGMSIRGVIGERNHKNLPIFDGDIAVQVTSTLYVFTIKLLAGTLLDYGWELGKDEFYTEKVDAKEISSAQIDYYDNILRLVVSKRALENGGYLEYYLRAYATNSEGTAYSNEEY